MKRLPLTLPLLALLAGCATTPRDPTDVARESACRSESERTILQQDRGQLMRADEADARLGTSGSVSSNYDSQALGRRFELRQMTDDCVRNSLSSAPGRRSP